MRSGFGRSWARSRSGLSGRLRTRLIAGVLASGSIAMVGAALASPASACSVSSHCYGIVYLPGSSFLGADADDRVNNIGISPGTDFENNEVWVINGSYWEEAGISKGIGQGGCSEHDSATFFWADNRPNGGGYHCHLGGGASANTDYFVGISYNGSASWSIQSGSLTGTSTGGITSGSELEGGVEMTNASIDTCTSLSNLGYLNGSGSSVSGWSDSSNGNASISQAEPPYTYWVSSPTWERTYANESC